MWRQLFMAISLQEVETITELAKLIFTDSEKALLQEQLSAILDYAAMLQQVDTTGILPMTSAIPLDNVMRPDEIVPSLDTHDALANAPATGDNSFKVWAVLE
jgi:aspartyl-tRNA(Asn)/glutamyl-tRNA(Gln) amidotransferase subunit C